MRIDLGPYGVSEALGIAEDGRIVGWAARVGSESAPFGPRAAMLWDGTCLPQDLNDITIIPQLGVGPNLFLWESLNVASDLNEGGVIVGSGTGIDGRTRAFLLIPLDQEPEED
jgi:hypothetical protein